MASVVVEGKTVKEHDDHSQVKRTPAYKPKTPTAGTRGPYHPELGLGRVHAAARGRSAQPGSCKRANEESRMALGRAHPRGGGFHACAIQQCTEGGGASQPFKLWWPPYSTMNTGHQGGYTSGVPERLDSPCVVWPAGRTRPASLSQQPPGPPLGYRVRNKRQVSMAATNHERGRIVPATTLSFSIGGARRARRRPCPHGP